MTDLVQWNNCAGSLPSEQPSYKEAVRRGITGNNEQRNNQNEETSEPKWENSEKVVRAVVSEVIGYAGRKKGNDW